MNQGAFFSEGGSDREHRDFEAIGTTGADLLSAASLIALMGLPGIGGVKAIKIADRFHSWENLRRASDAEIVKVAGRAGLGAADLSGPPALDEVDGVRVIGYFDDDYPASLKEISNRPAVLWCKGTLPPKRSIAIVGTRNPTPYGSEMALAFGRQAAKDGWGVVSGLALGVDGAAHRGALDAGAPTWAFLGSGVDQVTPTQHRELANDLVESGGGLIAEVPLGAETQGHYLVQRNRLQSGSSRATLVVQTGIPSGTLHTVKFTIEQERPLWVLKPDDGEQPKSWAGNAAFFDPQGCNPEIFNVERRGKLLDAISARKPLASGVLTSTEDLTNLLESITVP